MGPGETSSERYGEYLEWRRTRHVNSTSKHQMFWSAGSFTMARISNAYLSWRFGPRCVGRVALRLLGRRQYPALPDLECIDLSGEVAAVQ